MTSNPWPKTFETWEQAPEGVRHLIETLVPHLLAGEHPLLGRLREQFASATIGPIELTGAGLYAYFTVPVSVARVTPENFRDGDAHIAIKGLPSGAGCDIAVRGGALDFLDVYTYGADPWPETVEVEAIEEVTPALPSLLVIEGTKASLVRRPR